MQHYSDYLREQAAKYRELAENADDDFLKREFLELADICEEVANDMDDNRFLSWPYDPSFWGCANLVVAVLDSPDRFGECTRSPGGSSCVNLPAGELFGFWGVLVTTVTSQTVGFW